MNPFAHPLLEKNYFGAYGGSYVPDLLQPALDEIEAALKEALSDPHFLKAVDTELKTYAGRPTPLTSAPRLSEAYGARSIFIKREDLLHSGAHKINNALGQALLARFLGKKELIAETGAGQHGVAVAIAGARLGIPVRVFQGKKDIERQAPNAVRMKLLGASLHEVTLGSQTLKDAVNETFRYWMAHYGESFYVLGSAVGPAPYPQMVAQFQSVISKEIRDQVQGAKIDAVCAAVGGGSNAIGGFLHFIDEPSVRLVCAEAQGGASLAKGRKGILHGMMTQVLQDEDGQILETHSLSAGLDYPAVSPIHSYLRDVGRSEACPVSDEEALSAAKDLLVYEGILPALESAHALAAVKKACAEKPNQTLVVILSGRGDKDLATYQRELA